MKVGDRVIWQMRQTDAPIMVEIIRADREGWWVVQPLGQSTAHFAHVGELRPTKQSQPDGDA